MRISDWSSDVCSSDLAFGKIDDMDIVAHPGAVGGVVIVAEYRQFGQASRRDAADEGHQIVRNSARVFADQSAVMRADRVEIAQHRDPPGGVGGGDVGQHLLEIGGESCRERVCQYV